MKLSDNQSSWRKNIVNAVARLRQGVIALVAVSGCLSQTASGNPQITSVQFSGSPGNYALTVNGSGFGILPSSPPFDGDTSYFRIADAAQLGFGEWGYSGDAHTLTYQTWSDTQIQVSGFGGQQGDAITMALWNPTSGAGATWGGNVPGGSGTPQIMSVTFANSGQDLQIIVNGSGFGNAPVAMPFTGDLNYFVFGDFSTHCGGGSSLFGAGFNGWDIVSASSVALNYQSWSDNQIVVSGFAGSYGQGCATLQTGDPVVINVWNTGDASDTGPQTAWGGFAVHAGDAVHITTLVSFNGANGGGPVARLLQTADGNFYGDTYYGGPDDSGSIFRMTPSGDLTNLFFCGPYGGTALDGDTIYGTHFAGAPLQGSDGNFYFTTVNDGPTDWGAVLQMTPSGNVTAIASFNGANGQFGGSSLAEGSDSNLYGTTQYGGTGYNRSWGSGNGTVFVVTLAGELTVLHNFSGADGSGAGIGLTLGEDGNFYGVTAYGGLGYDGDNGSGNGTVFKITPSGNFTNLYSFTGGADGANPYRPLVLGADGNFYGTTYAGGSQSNGTVFRITASGDFTNLYSFSGKGDGANPSCELVQGTDGNFYGTTSGGGTNAAGTVFRIAPSGNLTTLYSFTGGDDGANPWAGLIQASDGNFYGTTQQGGANGDGTVFELAVGGEGCTYTLSATNVTLAAKGGSKDVSVKVKGADCTWTAVSNDPFITITKGSSGTNKGSVFLAIASNPDAVARTGTVSIADETFTVAQAAAKCAFALDTNAVTFTVAGGSSDVMVTANGGACAWDVVNKVKFITITSATSFSGDGTVTYTIESNATTKARTGTMTIAGKPFKVKQEAAP